MWRSIDALILTLALSAGCTNPSRAPLELANVPCLPPGLNAQFFSWPVVGFESVTLVTEGGNDVEAAWVLYRRGAASVAAIWTRSDLVAVDPHPDTEEPYWVDGSLVTDSDDNVLRTSPDGFCRWRRHTEGA
ncbi:MAG: hypothetical protein DMD91_17190 [Candidatus Rokuibacteriota bacterium]|nr:MAG: hypothetical protein DMD91_17190 [Candidatus Rokubacteria bacterium]